MEKIRRIIRKVLEETENLFEMEFIPVEPNGYKFFRNSNEEQQYAFQTKNENVYYLSFFRTCLYIKDEEVLRLYTNEIKEDKCLNFLAVNFFPEGKNPKDEKTFKDLTGNNEQVSLMCNIKFLLLEFLKNNTEERYFFFAAERKRMNMYKELTKGLSDIFHIFPPKIYDHSYDDEMIILIKK